ncbi:uncharacterized protein LOC108740066 [Agrilus planipennis]|uniref:Uncharacterized protein LOC108740066 n=1 Tax=Agrilus planipennis TaxID=224129 RepID=A0A1W4XBP5_AGRPL|nr:uncharacterized protein LOC108740066 [Agrilus planipennis]
MSRPQITQPASSIDRLAVKLPPFVPSDPELWFCMVERSFEASGVTSESTRFGYVLENLDPRYAAEVRDIIINPPATEPYATIKAALIRRLGTSQKLRTKQLLGQEEIGDRKPSQFLRHLQNLAGNSTPENLLRTIWSGRLPQNLQTVIATMKDKQLDEVAEIADYIMEATQTQSMIATTATPTKKHEDIQQLTNKVQALQMDLHQIRRHMVRGSRTRSRSHSRGTSSQRRSNNNNKSSDLCFYHSRFQDKARKCIPPCRKSSGNLQGAH